MAVVTFRNKVKGNHDNGVQNGLCWYNTGRIVKMKYAPDTVMMILRVTLKMSSSKGLMKSTRPARKRKIGERTA